MNKQNELKNLLNGVPLDTNKGFDKAEALQEATHPVGEAAVNSVIHLQIEDQSAPAEPVEVHHSDVA